MDYQILGPLEVHGGGRLLALGGDKQRALLASLLLHRNEVVSADRLIDDLWGESPPANAVRTLQVYLSRLRKALDAHGAAPAAPHRDPSLGSDDGVLMTRGHGYLLRVAPGELDLDRFRELVERGRDALAGGEPERAARALHKALGLWRGPPLADFTYEEFAQAAIAQLEELQLGATEDRVDADLALGRDREMVGELRDLVGRHPLRERLRGQLMLALYRSGRQAEALEVYQEFRHALSEQLGLEPGPALQQLEVAILNRDPSLDLPPGRRGSGPAVPHPTAAPGPRARRRRLVAALGALAVAALALVVVLVASGAGGSASLAPISPDSVGAINGGAGTIAADVPLESSPSSVAFGDGAIWVANYNNGTVSRIDPRTHAVVQSIPVYSTPSGIAVAPGAVWVANNFNGTVSWINPDPRVDRVVKTVPVGNGPSGVAVGYGSVWVANSMDATLSKVNATTGTPGSPIALGGTPSGVAVGLDAVWVSDATGGRVLRIDPQTGQLIQPVNVGSGPGAITIGYGSVWVANALGGTVSRIDPQTNNVIATISVGSGPDAIAAGAGGVWVANEYSDTVVRIDPTKSNIANTIMVKSSPRGVTVADGLVWASAQTSATAAHRGGTLIALQHTPVGSLDPANPVPTGAAVDILYMTSSGLTAYKRVGGSDGEQIVPDLATSVPSPTDGGLTYTFQLRSGIHYSNGQPVRASDFRRAIERDLEIASLSLFGPLYLDIVGAARCATHPGPCTLKRGIVTNDATGTVMFHLVSPDPEFVDKLALWAASAVPAGAPDHDVGSHPLPATGPYKVATVTPNGVVLVRNPYFHVWSAAAQPDGYPDRIVWRTGASIAAETLAVEHRMADYMLDGPPADMLGEVQTRYTGQLNVFPNDVTTALVLNTRKPPFNDLGVRQALNYAVDRNLIARLLGQDSQPACQLLPPYIPGYHRYCPYTLDPNPSGAWSAPNLPKAQALIAASRTRGTPITIWAQEPTYNVDFTSTGRYMQELLDSLGYPTRIRTFSETDGRFFLGIADSRTAPAAYFGLGLPVYPAASQFLYGGYGCKNFIPDSTNNANFSEWCDPQFDATVNQALAAEAAGTPSAPLWARADRELTDQAPLVDLTNPSTTDLVSRRVGNYQYNPQLGVIIDQLWVR